MKKNSPQQERVAYDQLEGAYPAELMHATYVTQSFPRHTHDGFGVGVIERGALGFYYRGENVVASEGMINLVNPGEVHTGHAAIKAGWTYRMFYLDAEVMEAVAGEIAGQGQGTPFFEQGVIRDPSLAAELYALHRDIESDQDSSLEYETRFLGVMIRLIQRHAIDAPALRRAGQEHQAVRRACEAMNDDASAHFDLQGLAEIAGLSPFYFIRVFQRQTGLTPHAYLMQRRVYQGKARLRRGQSIIDTAYACGFTDQSHFTRHFKRLFGLTPGQYRNSVQDS